MTYAERAVLLREAKGAWRLGHGAPASFELITGSGSRDLMVEATRLLEELICEHQRFVFVPSAPARRLLLSIGQALRPLEYAVVDWYSDHIAAVIERGEYYGEATVDTTIAGRRLTPAEWIRRFLREVASQVVAGVYRASELAPPQLFYAHKDHSAVAARIAIADSVLQAHRGFPLLLDLADRVCAASFGGDSLRGPLDVAYTEAGTPLRYLAERATQMPVLFQQVARIAKRGRKRWLGLVFVTQLPQHLPRQLFGLVNSYVLHKISDPQVVSTLERTVPGIDAGLWRRLPGLAPGQAIVAFPHLARPLLVAVDPAQAQLRLVD